MVQFQHAINDFWVLLPKVNLYLNFRSWFESTSHNWGCFSQVEGAFSTQIGAYNMYCKSIMSCFMIEHLLSL